MYKYGFFRSSTLNNVTHIQDNLSFFVFKHTFSLYNIHSLFYISAHFAIPR
jgi:hypothetical protein